VPDEAEVAELRGGVEESVGEGPATQPVEGVVDERVELADCLQ